MKKYILPYILFLSSCITNAQNPIVTHCYTADPAPAVFQSNDSLYIYCDEDMNVPGVNDFYYMERWRVYSTVDMVNWTDHGVAMPRTNFTWANEGTCWASQCVERNGTYYWYMCAGKKGDWKHYIGVGKSDKPSGPFKDARRTHIISTGEGGDIDPTVFIDDDGQTYLYWGNNKLMYVKLQSNMLLYSSSFGKNGIVEIPLTKEAFGGVKENDKINGADCYEEGPWLDKRGDNYYLIYAAGGVPEHISYSMSKSPTGPWVYKGQIMKQQDTGSFTNHSGIVNYKGKDYFFYHTGWAKGGGGFNRSMAVEEFRFNTDGTIPQITATRKGVKPLCTMNPYICQQAETMNAGQGVSVVGDESKGVYVTSINAGDSIRVRNVDFGDEGVASITLRIAAKASAGTLIIRQDNARGKQIAKCKLSSTGGENVWEEVTFDITNSPKGIHDLHFSFMGVTPAESSTLFNWDWWKFNTQEETAIKVPYDTMQDTTDNVFYDLTGRRTISPSNGIYLKKGRKILIKQ